MAYIIIMVLLVIICGGAILYGIVEQPIAVVGGVVALVVLGGSLTLLSSYHQVGSHEVGVVSGLSGVVDGSFGPGTHTTAPWASVNTQDTGIQKATFTGITAVSKDSQDVFLSVQVNYHLDPAAVVSLYKSVGGDWYDKFVPGSVTQSVKEETVKYNTVDLAPNRPKMSQDIEQNLVSLLEPHSIHVDAVYLLNVDYSQQFKQAIEQKQVASQQAQRAVLQAQGQRNAAAGQRDATIIRAEGQARANNIISRSINDRIIRYETIQRLAPNVKVILPSSGGIYNLGGLVK